jgi:TPR repeat protein
VRPWVAPLGLGLLLAGLVALAFPFRDTLRELLRSPPIPGVVVRGVDSPEARRCQATATRGLTAEGISPLATGCAAACAKGAGPSCRKLAALCSPAAAREIAALPPEICADGPATLLARGCKADDALSCTLASEGERAAVLGRACASGLGRSCVDLAALCTPLRPALSDDAPAARWAFLGLDGVELACSPGPTRLLERGCEQGDWMACEQAPSAASVTPSRRRAMLETACDRGEVGACRKLAGSLGPEEGATAAALVQYAGELEACSQKPGACEGLRGWRQRVGAEGVRIVKEQAIGSEQACAQGQVVACWEQAEALELGQGTARNPARAADFNSRALSLLRTRCKDQDGGACVSPEIDRQLTECDGGRGEGCLAAVSAYSQGNGSPGDLRVLVRRGVRRLDEACERGDPGPCGLLLDLHRRGEGGLSSVPDALTEAARRGCSKKNGVLCAELGRRLWDGDGAPRDRPGAERAYRQASGLLEASCAGGDRAACGELAAAYEAGRGVPRDEARAAELRARGGSAPAPASAAPASSLP